MQTAFYLLCAGILCGFALGIIGIAIQRMRWKRTGSAIELTGITMCVLGLTSILLLVVYGLVVHALA